MTLRILPIFGAAFLSLAMAGVASAQQYRVAPDTGYRSAPDYDDEDYPGASPGTYGRAPARPYADRPIYQEERPAYGPRYEGPTGSVPPQGAYRAPLAPPGDVGSGYQPQREAVRPAPAEEEYNRGGYSRAPAPNDRVPGPYDRAPPPYQQAPQYQQPPQEAARPPGNFAARPPGDVGAREPGARDPRDPREPRETVRGGATNEEIEAVQQGKIEEMDPRFRRRVVDYKTKEPAGTLIVDTTNTYLYLVMEGGKAMRYGIGVGREGFTWAGRQKISRMKEWPDWYPPAEMIERQPYLPRWMAGGPSNPMGARALYLGNTLYRIHGTNDPTTIGKFVSSGCIRLFNADVEDLYSRVQAGTNVVVLPKQGGIPTQLSPERLPGQPEPGRAASAPAPAQAAPNMTPRPRGGIQAQR
jgi:lipoprotein-anchoring transpeptidase ErfK/SrfK